MCFVLQEKITYKPFSVGNVFFNSAKSLISSRMNKKKIAFNFLNDTSGQWPWSKTKIFWSQRKDNMIFLIFEDILKIDRSGNTCYLYSNVYCLKGLFQRVKRGCNIKKPS